MKVDAHRGISVPEREVWAAAPLTSTCLLMSLIDLRFAIANIFKCTALMRPHFFTEVITCDRKASHVGSSLHFVLDLMILPSFWDTMEELGLFLFSCIFALSLWKPHFVHSLSIGFDAHNLCKAVMLLHQLENNFKVPFRGIGLLGSCLDACLIFFFFCLSESQHCLIC